VPTLRRLGTPVLRSVALLAAVVPAAGQLVAAPLGGTGRARGPASRTRRTLRLSTAEGLFAETFAAFAGATVLTGWALHLGASRLEVGLVGALPQLATLVQLPAAWVTAALGRRRVALVSITLSRQVLLVLAVLPFVAAPAEAARAVLLAVAALSAALGVVGNNAWVSWMGEVVPEAVRGRYFGRRTALNTLGGTVAGLGAGAFLDAWTARGDAGLALAALAVGASALGWVTTALLSRQHDPTGGLAAPPPPGVALAPLRDPAARGFLAYQVAWNAGVGFGGAYFTFHLLGNLKAGFAVAALHAAGVAAGRVVSAPLWGRAIDRLGARPVLAAASFAVAATPLLWIAAAPGRLWPIAVDAVVGGVAWGAHGLAVFALPLAYGTPRERPFYLAAFAKAGGVAYAAAAAAGGAVAALLPAGGEVLGHPVYPVHALFLCSALLRLAGACLALRIAERGAGTLAELHAFARREARAALTTAPASAGAR
jgi:MFS family permease